MYASAKQIRVPTMAFKIQRICYLNSQRGESVAPNKDLCPLKTLFFQKKLVNTFKRSHFSIEECAYKPTTHVT